MTLLLAAPQAWAEEHHPNAHLGDPVSLLMAVNRPLVVRDGKSYTTSDPAMAFSSSTLSRTLDRVNPDATGAEPLLEEEMADRLLRGVQKPESLVADPVRNRLALVSSAGATENAGAATMITLIDLETSSVKTLVDNGLVNRLPSFSPDGTRLAYFSVPPGSLPMMLSEGERFEGYSLRVVNVATGVERTVAPSCTIEYATCPPAWSPDGSKIALIAPYGGPGCQIHTVALDGSTSRSYAPALKGRSLVISVIWPENEFVLFTYSSGRFVGRLDLVTGAAEIVVPSSDNGCLSLSPSRKHFTIWSESGPGEIYSVTGGKVTNAENLPDSPHIHGRWSHAPATWDKEEGSGAPDRIRTYDL